MSSSHPGRWSDDFDVVRSQRGDQPHEVGHALGGRRYHEFRRRLARREELVLEAGGRGQDEETRVRRRHLEGVREAAGREGGAASGEVVMAVADTDAKTDVEHDEVLVFLVCLCTGEAYPRLELCSASQN